MRISPHGGEGRAFALRNSPDWHTICMGGWRGRDMFQIAKDEEIKAGKVTDIYFARTVEILKAKGINPRARAEIILKGFPSDWPWGIFAGLDEALYLLEGLPLTG